MMSNTPSLNDLDAVRSYVYSKKELQQIGNRQDLKKILVAKGRRSGFKGSVSDRINLVLRDQKALFGYQMIGAVLGDSLNQKTILRLLKKSGTKEDFEKNYKQAKEANQITRKKFNLSAGALLKQVPAGAFLRGYPINVINTYRNNGTTSDEIIDASTISDTPQVQEQRRIDWLYSDYNRQYLTDLKLGEVNSEEESLPEPSPRKSTPALQLSEDRIRAFSIIELAKKDEYRNGALAGFKVPEIYRKNGTTMLAYPFAEGDYIKLSKFKFENNRQRLTVAFSLILGLYQAQKQLLLSYGIKTTDDVFINAKNLEKEFTVTMDYDTFTLKKSDTRGFFKFNVDKVNYLPKDNLKELANDIRGLGSIIEKIASGYDSTDSRGRINRYRRLQRLVDIMKNTDDDAVLRMGSEVVQNGLFNAVLDIMWLDKELGIYSATPIDISTPIDYTIENGGYHSAPVQIALSYKDPRAEESFKKVNQDIDDAEEEVKRKFQKPKEDTKEKGQLEKLKNDIENTRDFAQSFKTIIDKNAISTSPLKLNYTNDDQKTRLAKIVTELVGISPEGFTKTRDNLTAIVEAVLENFKSRYKSSQKGLDGYLENMNLAPDNVKEPVAKALQEFNTRIQEIDQVLDKLKKDTNPYDKMLKTTIEELNNKSRTNDNIAFGNAEISHQKFVASEKKDAAIESLKALTEHVQLYVENTQWEGLDELKEQAKTFLENIKRYANDQAIQEGTADSINLYVKEIQPEFLGIQAEVEAAQKELAKEKSEEEKLEAAVTAFKKFRGGVIDYIGDNDPEEKEFAGFISRLDTALSAIEDKRKTYNTEQINKLLVDSSNEWTRIKKKVEKKAKAKVGLQEFIQDVENYVKNTDWSDFQDLLKRAQEYVDKLKTYDVENLTAQAVVEYVENQKKVFATLKAAVMRAKLENATAAAAAAEEELEQAEETLKEVQTAAVVAKRDAAVKETVADELVEEQGAMPDLKDENAVKAFQYSREMLEKFKSEKRIKDLQTIAKIKGVKAPRQYDEIIENILTAQLPPDAPAVAKAAAEAVQKAELAEDIAEILSEDESDAESAVEQAKETLYAAEDKVLLVEEEEEEESDDTQEGSAETQLLTLSQGATELRKNINAASNKTYVRDNVLETKEGLLEYGNEILRAAGIPEAKNITALRKIIADKWEKGKDIIVSLKGQDEGVPTVGRTSKGLQEERPLDPKVKKDIDKVRTGIETLESKTNEEPTNKITTKVQVAVFGFRDAGRSVLNSAAFSDVVSQLKSNKTLTHFNNAINGKFSDVPTTTSRQQFLRRMILLRELAFLKAVIGIVESKKTVYAENITAYEYLCSINFENNASTYNAYETFKKDKRLQYVKIPISMLGSVFETIERNPLYCIDKSYDHAMIDTNLISVLKSAFQKHENAIETIPGLKESLSHIGLPFSSKMTQEKDFLTQTRYLHCMSIACEILNHLESGDEVPEYLLERCISEWPTIQK